VPLLENRPRSQGADLKLSDSFAEYGRGLPTNAYDFGVEGIYDAMAVCGTLTGAVPRPMVECSQPKPLSSVAGQRSAANDPTNRQASAEAAEWDNTGVTGRSMEKLLPRTASISDRGQFPM